VVLRQVPCQLFAGRRLYADYDRHPHLFKVAMADGRAGEVTALQTSRKLTLPDSLRTYGNDTFLMIEGGGSLNLVTVKGETAEISTIKAGFGGPVSVTQVGSIAWVAEGQLDHLLDPEMKKQPPKLPFHLYAVPLPPQ